MDQQYLTGHLFNRLGRRTGLQLADDAAEYRIVDISDHIQVIAMANTSRHTLDKTKAAAGARMLFQGGKDLLTALRAATMLRSYEAEDGTSTDDCTSLSVVMQYFTNIVYVILRSPGHAPHAHIAEPLCTCVSYCRYAGREHVEYVKTLSVRLRPATTTTDTLPELKRRGRKRGHTLTKRGEAKAKAKATAKCKAKGKANANTKINALTE